MGEGWRAVPVLGLCAALLAGCAAGGPAIPVNRGSVAPGTSVTARGTPVRLLGTPIAVGSPLPATALVDAATMQNVDLSRERGRVLFLSLVVSIDTGV